MKALLNACFLVAIGVLLISLSGCTMSDLGIGGGGDEPTEGIMSAQLMTDLVRVKTDDYANLDLVVGNPSNLEYYTQNSYKVSAKVISLGLFDKSSDIQEKSADMLGVKEKRFTWKLNTPPTEEIAAESPTEVLVQLKVDKKEVFTMPPILFATQEAYVSNEVRGSPIQGGPKTLTFSDNFITVVVDLNQQPPIVKESCKDEQYVFANVKFIPINGLGTINIDSASLDEGECSEIDNLAKTAQCKFKCDTPDITEKRFKFTVTYNYKLDLGQEFIIYPYKP